MVKNLNPNKSSNVRSDQSKTSFNRNWFGNQLDLVNWFTDHPNGILAGPVFVSKNCINPQKKNIYANHAPVSDALSQGFSDFNSLEIFEKKLKK